MNTASSIFIYCLPLASPYTIKFFPSERIAMNHNSVCRWKISRAFVLMLLIAPTGLLPSESLHADEPTSNKLPSNTWPQWRGPSRDGIVPGDQAWPDKLDEAHLNQIWRVELGPSYSGPIVTSELVFATETRDKKTEFVRAFDRRTGEQRWEASWEGAISVPFFAKSNGDWIRATPAWDGEHLYVAGIRDVLVCFHAATGKEVWRVDFPKQFDSPSPTFGFVSSPLVLGEFIFVQAGGAFVKLNKRTGEVVWRVLEDGGGMNGSAFSSPFITQLHGTTQILVQTRTDLAGVDPELGTVLWKLEIPAFRGMNIVTPAATKAGIFTSSYGGKSLLLQPNSTEEKWTVDETWQNKTQGYMSSPVIVAGHVYLHLRNQRFVCINLETGKETWTTKPYGQYWSLLAHGDKLLALDEKGELLLMQANPTEFTLLDRRTIGEDSWAHLAVVGDEVFVRTLDALTVYRWKKPAPETK